MLESLAYVFLNLSWTWRLKYGFQGWNAYLVCEMSFGGHKTTCIDVKIEIS